MISLPLTQPLISSPSKFERILEKANHYLDYLKIELGDPVLSETSFFQLKKSQIFLEISETRSSQKYPSLQNSPLKIQNDGRINIGLQLSSELYKSRIKTNQKSFPLIEPLEFLSPQFVKKTLKKKISIENFSQEKMNSSLLELDSFLSEEDKTEPSLNMTTEDNKKKKKSVFSTFFQRETLEDLEKWNSKENKKESESCGEDEGC